MHNACQWLRCLCGLYRRNFDHIIAIDGQRHCASPPNSIRKQPGSIEQHVQEDQLIDLLILQSPRQETWFGIWEPKRLCTMHLVCPHANLTKGPETHSFLV